MVLLGHVHTDRIPPLNVDRILNSLKKSMQNNECIADFENPSHWLITGEDYIWKNCRLAPLNYNEVNLHANSLTHLSIGFLP